VRKIILFIMLSVMPAFAANPFNMGRVSYFSQERFNKRVAKMQEAIDWREPILNADGKTVYYIPPDPVLTFLNNPSPENAKAYLEWQHKKTERIIKAQKVLAQVHKGDG
jgi:hypothetical protein